MKAKRPSKKRAKSRKSPGSTRKLSEVKFTLLQMVRMLIDTAIALPRCKDKSERDRLKEALTQYPFDGNETFRLLNFAAENSGNDLAIELAGPARVVIDAISQMAWNAHAIADHSKHEHWRSAAARVSEQVDFALALILRD